MADYIAGQEFTFSVPLHDGAGNPIEGQAGDPQTDDPTVEVRFDDGSWGPIENDPVYSSSYGIWDLTLTADETANTSKIVSAFSHADLRATQFTFNYARPNLIVLPLSATAQSNGRLDPTYLTAYQFCKIQASIEVNDADGNAIDLSGKDLSMVAWPTGDVATAGFELLSTGGSPALSVGGDDNNVITIDAAATYTQTAIQYDFRIYNTTDDEIVVDGVLKVSEGRAPA